MLIPVPSHSVAPLTGCLHTSHPDHPAALLCRVVNVEDGRRAALKVMRLEDGHATACAAGEAEILAAGLDCCLSLQACTPVLMSVLVVVGH